MSAPEIHPIHPLRDQVDVQTLYRLLYNRVTSRNLRNVGGAFWPINQPLPQGWEHSRPPAVPGKARPGRPAKQKSET
jgi:hypothetical protein